MFKHTLATILALASFINPTFVLADETARAINLTERISNTYLNSAFGAATTPVTPIADPNAGFMEKFKQQIDPKTQLLTAREVQEIAFNIVSSAQNFDANIIDTTCIDKLEIVGGGENNSQLLFNNIFSHINTAAGKAYAAFTFCNPIADIQALTNRQNVIAYLNNNKKIQEQIDLSLKNISPFENKSYTFWHLKPIVNQDLIRNSYFGTFINNATLQQLNTNTAALELLNRGGIALMVGSLAAIPSTIVYAAYNIAKQNNVPLISVLKDFKSASINLLKSISIKGYISAAAGTVYIGGAFYLAGSIYVTYEKMYKHIQDILITTASHIKELQSLSKILHRDPELLKYLPSLQPLADFNNSSKHSAQLNKLLGMLNTNTFKGEASFLSIAGRVLATYELMKQVKEELAPVFAAAGELDMYVALAKLYNSREGKEARYCMVEFVENSATPIIDTHNFWNPFINPDIVIVNDATFDLSCPNSILTGPNTGGKSTVIKALMIDVLMAQTFGIAAAESFTITPFTKLNCFMNISDDIAIGASLFKSEVMRAKKLLELVQSLKENEFSFVIIDEVFTGTSPQEGEQAALRFAKHMGTYRNNISIIATHYPKMVDLETETNGNYRNHHVEILRNEDGSLNRTFKLKNGPTFMNVAFDILEEEGLFV